MSVSFEEVYRLARELPPEDRHRLAEALLNPPPLTAEAIIAALEAQAAALRALGVRRLGLFGPYAAGTAEPSEEIDLLAALEEPTFDAYRQLRALVEHALDHPVDVVVESAQHGEVRPLVMTRIIDVSGL
ncbi:MAG: nucleotidyltransferase domain-containing protein [Anaerolineae bacterium]|nr:nucleotidyltransferase domain-containing protein [Anaerolineae bacterium]